MTRDAAHQFPFVENDGGRPKSFGEGRADCAVRAIAIASGVPYIVVYRHMLEECRKERRKTNRSDPDRGVHRPTYERVIFMLGGTWTPMLRLGSRERVYLYRGLFPEKGRYVVSMCMHLLAMVDGVIHDTGEPYANGLTCVYGRYEFPVRRSYFIPSVLLAARETGFP